VTASNEKLVGAASNFSRADEFWLMRERMGRQTSTPSLQRRRASGHIPDEDPWRRSRHRNAGAPPYNERELIHGKRLHPYLLLAGVLFTLLALTGSASAATALHIASGVRKVTPSPAGVRQLVDGECASR
jgi:hypothetical protein